MYITHILTYTLFNCPHVWSCNAVDTLLCKAGSGSFTVCAQGWCGRRRGCTPCCARWGGCYRSHSPRSLSALWLLGAGASATAPSTLDTSPPSSGSPSSWWPSHSSSASSGASDPPSSGRVSWRHIVAAGQQQVSQLINNQFKPPSPFSDRSISKTTKTPLVQWLGELGPDGTVSEYSVFISPTMSFVEVKKQSRYNRWYR